MRRGAVALARSAAGLLAVGAVTPASAGPDALRALLNRARPVVVLSDAPDDPRVARQVSALDRVRPALDERNIAVLREAGPGGPLREALGVAERGFAVVLVGKDGSVKHVWHDTVDPGRIFTLIDAMPMRRREMRG